MKIAAEFGAGLVALAGFTLFGDTIAQGGKLLAVALDAPLKQTLFANVDVSEPRGFRMRWHLRSADILALAFKTIGFHLLIPASAQPMTMKKMAKPMMEGSLMSAPNLSAPAAPR